MEIKIITTKVIRGATTKEVEIEAIEGEGDIMLGRAMDIKVKVVIIMEVI